MDPWAVFVSTKVFSDLKAATDVECRRSMRGLSHERQRGQEIAIVYANDKKNNCGEKVLKIKMQK